MRRHTVLLFMVALLLLVITPACALGNLVARNDSNGPVPTPSFTPKPTFTATAVVIEEPLVAPTFTPTATPDATTAPLDTPTPDASPTPDATATPQTARAVIDNPTLNVRSGPGTTYGTLGQVRNGERYDITGKNAAGSWYEINFNGQTGWVSGDYINIEGDPASIAQAANIPAAPVQPVVILPTPRPVVVVPPTATAVPAPAGPTATPVSSRKFNVAVVQRCDRQPAGNWFKGTVYVGGQPSNGQRVVFSYAPDGPWVTSPQISGPHEGYSDWGPGFYSHVINAPGVGPKAGSWSVWIVDANGGRISEIATWQSTGPGDGCNEAVVDFDSR